MGRENQLVGAFGERTVEAELLRRGWLTSNVNASIKNAADYDIIAVKKARTIHLRIKTCGAGFKSFQFGGFRPGEEISVGTIPDSDYTVLVQMSTRRDDDSFWVVPTKVVRQQIRLHRLAYMKQPKRDGGLRKDIGHWTLHLDALQSGEDRPARGLREKWKSYLDNWSSLEG
ncbi:MAG TPA: hypothetical protein VJN67_21165 [Stellaceae bacterium]|nr:hypothetical protein [Stellaceae bacterium]